MVTDKPQVKLNVLFWGDVLYVVTFLEFPLARKNVQALIPPTTVSWDHSVNVRNVIIKCFL